MLHVVRYNRNELDKLVEQINASGYGLTLGVHTRIDETIAQSPAARRWATCTSTAIWLARWSACSRSAAKGCPVPVQSRRSAVPLPPALQPSAGRGWRDLRPPDAERPLDAQLKTLLEKPLQALQQWAAGRPELQALCQQYSEQAQSGTQRLLPGPTGERNTLTLMPRERVLCVADNEQDALIQLAAVLAVGCEVLWPDSALQRDLAKKLPRDVSERIRFAKADQLPGPSTRLSITATPTSCASCASRWRRATGRLSPCRASPAAKPICCWSGCTSSVR